MPRPDDAGLQSEKRNFTKLLRRYAKVLKQLLDLSR